MFASVLLFSEVFLNANTDQSGAGVSTRKHSCLTKGHKAWFGSADISKAACKPTCLTGGFLVHLEDGV